MLDFLGNFAALAAIISPLVTALVEVIKRKFGAESWAAIVLTLAVAIGLNGIFTVLYGYWVWQNDAYVYTTLDQVILFFGALVFSLQAWVMSMGWYTFIRRAKNGQ